MVQEEMRRILMMKQWIVLALMLCLSLISDISDVNAYADRRKIQIAVSGNFVDGDVDPILLNGRTQVPIRFVAEALGYQVDWKPDRREVELTNGRKRIVFTIGSNLALADGKKVEVDNEAFIQSGRTYLPLRFIGESFGESVSYDENTHTAIIGRLPVTVFTEEKTDLRGLIDLQGKIVLPPSYKYIGELGNQRFVVRKSDSEKAALMDADGNILTEYKYDYIDNFENGYAIVSNYDPEHRSGIIDLNGKEILEVKYPILRSFSEGYFVLVDPETMRAAYADQNGKITYVENARTFSSFSEGIASYAEKEEGSDKYKCGLIDKNFNKILGPKYDDILAFSEGRAVFRVGDEAPKWGVLDRQGKEIVEAKYDMVNAFKGGRAVVTLNGKNGLIDADGKELVKPTYEGIFRLTDKLYAYNVGGTYHHGIVGGKWGLLDQNGKAITRAIYDRIEIGWDYPYGYIPVCKLKADGGELWGMIDGEGKIVLPIEYTWISPFSDGLAIVCKGEHYDNTVRYGAIDKDGKIVFEIKYDYLSAFQNGIAQYGVHTWMPSGEQILKLGLINKKGKPITEPIYSAIELFK